MSNSFLKLANFRRWFNSNVRAFNLQMTNSGLSMRRLVYCMLLLVPAAVPASMRAARLPPPATLGVLVYGTTQEPDTLNPLITQTVAGQTLDSAVFDSLIRLDSHNVLQPDLALSWGHSSDGKTWTFHLRHNVRWADNGQLFTSTDVFWTFLAVTNPKNNVATTQGWGQVSDVTTPDRFTAVFHLRRLLAPWLVNVGTTAIVPKHYLYLRHDFNDGAWNRMPFGTGPYRVAQWQQGDHITLVANPHYWQGMPRLRTIIYRIFPDDARLLAALRTRAVGMGAVNPLQAPIAAHIASTTLVESPSMTWYHVDLKQWGFLREQAVRQALDFATPKGDIVREVLGGHGQVAIGDIAPEMTNYYNPSVSTHPFNLLRAAEILAADGFRPRADGVLVRDGQPLSIALWSVAGDYFGAQVNARLRREWAKIGIQVRLNNALVSQIFGPTGPQFSQTLTGITYGWTNTSDPDDRFYWNSAYIPASPSAPGGNAMAYFFHFSFQTQIDSLTNLGVLQTDSAKRQVVYKQIQALLADQAPVIFLYWQNTLMVTPRALHGYQPSPFQPLFWNVGQWR